MITITITGPQGSGKTIIANLVRQSLPAGIQDHVNIVERQTKKPKDTLTIATTDKDN